MHVRIEYSSFKGLIKDAFNSEIYIDLDSFILNDCANSQNHRLRKLYCRMAIEHVSVFSRA